MPNRVRIVRTRDTCGGAPRIAESRMTTNVLYRGWLANGRDAAIVARWMEVPVEWVEAAVAYERRWWRRLMRWTERVLRGEEP